MENSNLVDSAKIMLKGYLGKNGLPDFKKMEAELPSVKDINRLIREYWLQVGMGSSLEKRIEGYLESLAWENCNLAFLIKQHRLVSDFSVSRGRKTGEKLKAFFW